MSNTNNSDKKGFWSRLASFFSGCDNCCCQPRPDQAPTETMKTTADDKSANGKTSAKGSGCDCCKGK